MAISLEAILPHAAAILALALLCGLWVIIQRSLGEDRANRPTCCRHLDLDAADFAPPPSNSQRPESSSGAK